MVCFFLLSFSSLHFALPLPASLFFTFISLLLALCALSADSVFFFITHMQKVPRLWSALRNIHTFIGCVYSQYWIIQQYASKTKVVFFLHWTHFASRLSLPGWWFFVFFLFSFFLLPYLRLFSLRPSERKRDLKEFCLECAFYNVFFFCMH